MTKYDSFIGKLLDNKYRILDVVGSGGMAVVLKAEDINMKRLVAIKILNDEYTGNEQAEKRFANEAKAVAMLSHRNIVSIYDIAMYPDMKYIVMEYLDGITLREYLDNKGALPWKEAFIYALQILRALEHAHGKGVIHRDIKPQNVMLLKSGEIKVTDFGIAKLPSSHSLTLTQKAIGTVYYISPEQACGKNTTFASDLYSLGIMLYEAVTGALPFTGDNSVQIAMQQVNNAPQDPTELVPSLPVGAKQIILKALEKDPANRFSSAHGMAKAIEWLLRNPDVVFADTGYSDADNYERVPAVSVSIDMINTTDIEPYGQTEIVESIVGEKPKNKKTKAKKERRRSSGDQSDERRRPRKSRSMFPIISGSFFAILLVALVIGVLALITALNTMGLFGNSGKTEEGVFPDLIGEIYSEQLIAQLENGSFGKNIKVDSIKYVENNNFVSGQITDTEPVAGHKSKLDESGYLHFTSISICKRVDDSLVPDVKYLKSNNAKLLLRAAPYNYDVKVSYEDNKDFFEDQVIRTSPAIGEVLDTGGTITIYVCRHTTEYQLTDAMPNLMELTESEAVARAGYALYTPQVVYRMTGFFEPGTVIDQSIPAGTVSEAGAQVIITVAKVLTDTPMESLIGRTYADAEAYIFSLGMSIDKVSCYYVAKGDILTTGFAYDYEAAVLYAQMNGYISTYAENGSIPQNAVIILQSVPTEQLVTEGDTISLIFAVDPTADAPVVKPIE